MHLRLEPARITLWIAIGIVFCGIFGAMIRFLPVVLSENVPWSVWAIVGKGTVAAALEVGALLAPPIGWSVWAAACGDRGDSAALFGLGLSPRQLLSPTLPILILIAALGGLASFTWGVTAVAPGRTSAEMLSAARASCVAESVHASEPAVADVPLVGLSWVCFPDHKPRLVGPMPSDRMGAVPAVVVAHGVEVGSDLRRITLFDTHITASVALGSGRSVRTVSAQRLTITGVRSSIPTSAISPLWRAFVVAASSAILAYAAGLRVFAALARGTRASSPRLRGAVISTAGSILATFVFLTLDRSNAPLVTYVFVPICGIVALWVASLVSRLV